MLILFVLLLACGRFLRRLERPVITASLLFTDARRTDCRWLGHIRARPGEDTIRLTVMAAVFLSIFAHGFTALPGINFYARKIESLPANAPEHENSKIIVADGHQTKHS